MGAEIGVTAWVDRMGDRMAARVTAWRPDRPHGDRMGDRMAKRPPTREKRGGVTG